MKATTTTQPITLGQSTWLPTILALLFCFLWASAFSVTKAGLEYMPPFTLLSIRFVIAGGILALIALGQRQAWPQSRSDLIQITVFGLLNTGAFFAFTGLSLEFISAGMGAIIASTNPLMLALVAPWLLKERLDWVKGLGLLLGFGGVCWVMLERLGGGEDTLAGMLLALTGVVSLVAATLMFKRMAKPASLLTFNAIQLVAGGVGLAAPALLFEWGRPVAVGWPLVGIMLYLIGVMSILAMLIWFWLLRRGEASRVSAYFFLTPLFGLAISALALGEQFGGRELLGLVAVVAGIALVNRPNRQSE